MGPNLSHLDELESTSIYILREAYANYKKLCMLWSIGKDSTVLLWLSKKAFLGHIPFPLVHIDTSYKIPEMIEFRDRLALEWNLNMIVGKNEEAIEKEETYPDGRISRIECCRNLKSIPLKNTIFGKDKSYVFNHKTQSYEIDNRCESYTGVIVGIRSDEEGSRSKEIYFSPRDERSDWKIENRPPELWDKYKIDCLPGTHVRIHPLLDWTEIDVWEYIKREEIPVVSLYFDQGNGKRYRSLGCMPCSLPIDSKAKTVEEIIYELKHGNLKNVPERSGREQDKEDAGGLEFLRRDGYM